MRPNDPLFPTQWESAKVGLPKAWDTTTGSSKVIIAVLDTGVATSNRDLAGKVLAGRNVVTGGAATDRPATDHGTKMAGIAAAIVNNGFGMAGVAPGCPILPVQVTTTKNGYASWPDVAAGLRWAADHGAKVAIVAYSPFGSAQVEQAAGYFRSKGGLVFIAAGNDGKELPAKPSDAWIVVTATDKDDRRFVVANYGPAVQLAAPGVKLTTTSWYDLMLSNTNSGTSEATAFAAGVAALVFSANPKLTAAEVETILKNTADDLGAPGPDPYFGWGRVNAAKAVAAAVAQSPPPAAGAARSKP